MLDTVRRMGELKELVAAAREEREALSAVIASLTVKKRPIEETMESLAQTQKLAQTVAGALDRVSARLDAVDERTRSFTDVDTRVERLIDQLGDLERTVLRLKGPEGELARHQAIADQLTSQEMAARANVELIRQERQSLDDMRDQLRHASTEVREAVDRFSAVKSEIDQARALGAQLGQDYGRMRDASREARDLAHQALDAAKDADTRVSSLRTLDDLAKTARERINSLNVLVEHVTQKARTLEAQKQTLEHAIVEQNRLSDLVWNMDAQIARLNDGMRQMAQAEGVVDRLSKAGQDAAQQLDAAHRARDLFQEEVARVDRDRAGLAEFVRANHERIDAERRQLDQFTERVGTMQASLAALETSAAALAVRDRSIVTMAQQIDALENRTAALGAGIAGLQEKQATLDDLRAKLTDVEDFARTTTQQYAAMRSVRDDLALLKQQLDVFHKAHAEAAQMRDSIEMNRLNFTAFLDRMDGFRALMPELDARLNTIGGKLSVVNEGAQKATNLVALADNLDRQMTRILNNQKLIDKVEGRINALNVAAADVDRKVDEQLQRRLEIDTLKNACDRVAVQVTDLLQKIEAVTAVQATLTPVTGAVEVLRADIERAQARLQSVQREEAFIVDQEKRLAELVMGGRTTADAVAVTLKQVQTLTDELKRSATVKDDLVQELVAVQARQRDVASHASVSDDQLKRLESALAQIEQRRSQMAFVDKTVAGFESKLGQLRKAADDLDVRIDDVAARTGVVDAVRREVEGVRELSAQSKADLQSIEDRRSDIASIKQQVEQMLLRASQTQDQLARIETRKRDVDEIFDRTSLIVSMLEDVRLNLEMVNEQKAVVDHVAGDLARLDVLVQSGQRTLQSLQAERELAERIERSIKALRSRTTGDEESRRLA